MALNPIIEVKSVTLKQLPSAIHFSPPKNYSADLPSDVLDKWGDTPRAEFSSDDDNVITIYDQIGVDFWGDGVSAKRIAGALRRINSDEVRVRINSPGGDVFEGISIFNLLRADNRKVIVEVVGIAASAASIIAMAGDEIVMGLGSFMMVHNVWGGVVGNQHDFRQATEMFEQFDEGLVDIYEAATGQSRSDIMALMDRDTFMSGQLAVDNNFAHRVDESLNSEASEASEANTGSSNMFAKRIAEKALAAAGKSRPERQEILNKLSGGAERDAGASNEEGKRDAALLGDPRDAIVDPEIEASLRNLKKAILKD